MPRFTLSLALLAALAGAELLVSVPLSQATAGDAVPAAGSVSTVLPGGAPDETLGKHLHNCFRLSEQLTCGAAPETDDDFVALVAAGMKVLVSVDGAAPDVEAARRHGLRYVHLPIGYDGIPADKALLLAKAFTSLKGPFYVHCHHGMHRGPAAAAIGRILLDKVTPEQAVAEMKRAGTDARYRGLYAAPVEFKVPDAATLAAVSADLPSVSPIPALEASMVEADHRWDRMKAVRTAGWATPKDQPDVEPSHEAVMLAEWFRELARRPDVTARGPAFVAGLSETEKAAWDLSKALGGTKPDTKAAQSAFDRVQQSCASCHSQFRDNNERHPAK